MKRILPLLLLTMGFSVPLAKADRYYYDDEPVVRHRVYSERSYAEPDYRYRRTYRDDDRYYEREDRPRYILPPGPHRIIQHILFGDPWR